ncbi:hypothetical protein KIN20_035111 [Parelaphostrongylus tenuis]|uniref:ATP-dependent RNA helicase n=1 Tax=Parelaphostrongylus tenuis TaxID=148309 RepID=A0AAD5WJF7_PARTN|nr:hypothetical protein KIN20_035111 [Parelaphostrongylus tenuis]
MEKSKVLIEAQPVKLMPKLIKLSSGAKWKSGAVAGNFENDEFGYLGLFEELLPEHQGVVKSGGKKKKKKISKKKNEATDGKDGAESQESKITEMKAKRKKKKAKIGLEDVESKDQSVEEETNKVKRLNKIGRKRKGEKFVASEKIKKMKCVAEEALECSPMEAEAPFVSSTLRESETMETNGNNVDKDLDYGSSNAENWKEFYLPDPILKAIMDMGFENPTEIQRQVLPMALRDRCDVLGAAETGSGKTLAYAIPLTARLLELQEDAYSNKTGPKALVLAPTRELVMQVMKHLTALLKHTRFKAFPIVGGLAQVRQSRILEKQTPEVVVATPGRLWAMMQYVSENEAVCPYLTDWTGLRCLVIDETDRMIEKGHFEEMEDILKLVRKSATRKLQTLVFSATLTYVNHVRSRDGKASKEFTPQQKIMQLIHLTGMRPECKIVDITRSFWYS